MSDVPKLEPFLGRALIEALQTEVKEHLYKKAGLDMADSRIALPESYLKKNNVPLCRGKILKKASDFGGIKFKSISPDVDYVPDVGDIVFFIPNETYAIDAERKYHLVNDCDIVGYEKC